MPYVLYAYICICANLSTCICVLYNHTRIHAYQAYIGTLHLLSTRYTYIHIFYTGKPADAPMNVRISEKKNDSFTVQWDPVTDIFPINYTVRWYGEDIDNTTTTNELSYNVMGLTGNTSYSVTVVAINTCCGAGPVSDVIMVTTSTSPSNDGMVMYVCSYVIILFCVVPLVLFFWHLL